MKRYYGNYLGIVIDDLDPLYRNRIKVFIPTILSTILEKLNSKNKNIKISQVGFNIKNALEEEVYEELKRTLPWAECAAPLFGGGTSLHYNPYTKKSTNKNNLGSLNKKDSKYNGENIIQSDLTIGDNISLSIPGSSFDSFANNNAADVLNENSYRINSSYTSIIPGGMFSTPKVNSHVWVFFNEGDPEYPIYFAHHIVHEDWHRVKQATESFNPPLIPSINEDIDASKDSTYTLNLTAVGGGDQTLYSTASSVSATPPSKYIACDDTSNTNVSTLAQPGAGVVEFITHQYKDKNVIAEDSGIKISTVTGNVISLMSSGITEYAAINKTVKVGGSQFLTVENCKEDLIKGSSTTHVKEDLTEIVGNINTSALTSISALKDIYNEIAIEYIKDITQAEFTRVECPICYAKTIDDSGTYENTIKLRESRATSNLSCNTAPRDTVGTRSVLSVLDILSVPGKQALYKDIHQKLSCGNPNCINNQIIDVNISTQKSSAKSVQRLKQKHSDISLHEEKTGVGGNKIEIIAKNQTTKVGILFNDIDPYVVIKNALPIKNGINFFDKKGIAPQGDSVDILKDVEVPGIPIGVSENFIGTKYSLIVGSKGISIQTIGNVLVQGGNVNISGDSITLNNNTGLTKINGAAIILEASKSITLGGQPTNVHVNGSLHADANITAQGSIYSNNNIYGKRLVIPASIQKTDTGTTADYSTGMGISKLNAIQAFTDNLSSKQLKHYDKIQHGDYLSTELGMYDLVLDWLTLKDLNADLSVIEPNGLTVGTAGISIALIEPHIHLLHSNAHEHSFRGPNSFYLNDKDELYSVAAATGKTLPDCL